MRHAMDAYYVVGLVAPSPSILYSKGMSDSALPYRRTPPSWLKVTSEEINEQIIKLAKKGLTPSQIGVILRDLHGVAQVKNVTGSKILRILKANGMTVDLFSLSFSVPHSFLQFHSMARSLDHSFTFSSFRSCFLCIGLAPEIPEDLYHLIKKAVSVRKHLERNRKDRDSKYRLILIESRIHRLARYYKTAKQLPAVWKYEAASASALVA